MNRRDLLSRIGHGAAATAIFATGVADAIPMPAQPDPLLCLIDAYRQGLKIYNEQCGDDFDTEQCAALASETYEPHYSALCDTPPDATTLAGAIEAVRLVADEEENCGHQPSLTINVLRVALAYFDGRA